MSWAISLLWLASGVRAQTLTPNAPSTSLAMIILYAITGCVSALFCIVIISGAIRAIRHPERYGPRAGDGQYGSAPAQSRARGLTRAILDTFPVVKFGVDPSTTNAHTKDVENGESIEMEDHDKWEIVEHEGAQSGDGHVSKISVKPGEQDEAAEERSDRDGGGEERNEGEEQEEKDVVDELPSFAERNESPGAGSSQAEAAPTARPRLRSGRSQGESSTGERSGEQKNVVPDAIGRETCPICIVDFEEGDDLRVLPCEGHHRFHRDCVDQWLLELSSSCPICRQDFHALETMMAGGAGDDLEPPHLRESLRPLSTAAARFSRYLHIARRRHGDRHQGREDGSGYDITDPPMPMSADMRF
ncbi:uncharacterized protein LAESUDRAFT_721063 [Laetiporus sulphureus 93-53]|uniref:RING-type domain-containing protein n=1 Tax=Laetiporus sulphureus 93-53 TaxID=1314785 RepID=A0A165GRA6_9APHY|nr:uncharacterized protein LAESUDRAFT_721063 [Laetiporus sulphureus 93-53]KZT10698.1 hypothetical protein LAESUDRAFT_721063 [Laetiporus sulphureus 93-53]